MSDSIQPINFAEIEKQAAKRESTELEGDQIDAKARFVEDTETWGLNPRTMERRRNFKTLENRRTQVKSADKKITEVKKRTEEDLAQSFNKRNPELPPDRLRDLRSAIQSKATPEQILGEVSKSFEDVTLAEEALEYLEQSTEGELGSLVSDARQLLNAQKKREIIAGRNVDHVAKSYHEMGVGKNPTELRELYRDITGNPRPHNTLFSELMKLYNYDKLKLVVAFLLQGMSYDLKSKGPSIQPPELMRLMTEIRNLQSILWVHLYFKKRIGLIKSLYRSYGLTYSDLLSFELLAKEFISLVEERYPSVMKLLKQLERFGPLDDLEKIIVLMQFRDAIRELSPRLYKSQRHRDDLQLVILETLDHLEETDEDDNESI